MTFFGRILQVDDRETHLKTAIGVETGYGTDVYTIRIPLNMAKRKPLVEEQVLFTGREGRTEDASDFKLESIRFTEFTTCLECGFPLTSEACIIKHDKEAQKLDGEWDIFHKVENNGHIKLFFLQGRYQFSTVARPINFTTMRWLYEQFKNLKEGDKVRVRGWRYKTKTSISFIKKITYK